jgi:hypothetical protein
MPESMLNVVVERLQYVIQAAVTGGRHTFMYHGGG